MKKEDNNNSTEAKTKKQLDYSYLPYDYNLDDEDIVEAMEKRKAKENMKGGNESWK